MAPGVCAPDHDISPPVDEQLVLELEHWILGMELLHVFLGCWDKDMMHPTGQMATDCAFRLRSDRAMVQRRQWRERWSLEFLEQPDVEHNMNASSGW